MILLTYFEHVFIGIYWIGKLQNFCFEPDAKRIEHTERTLTDAAKEARSAMKSSRKASVEEFSNVEALWSKDNRLKVKIASVMLRAAVRLEYVMAPEKRLERRHFRIYLDVNFL